MYFLAKNTEFAKSKISKAQIILANQTFVRLVMSDVNVTQDNN